jgi:predicted RNA-binding Zn-ribbon protein involved in translation (DUF1610 family)
MSCRASKKDVRMLEDAATFECPQWVESGRFNPFDYGL